MNQVVICDFSWMYHKSWHTFQRLTWKNGLHTVCTGGMYGVLRDIVRLNRRWSCPIIVALEPESNQERYDVMPTYKGERTKDPGFFACYPATIRALKLFSFVQVITSDQMGEADDVIYSFAAQTAPIADRVLVYARDNDLFQLGGIPGADTKIFFLEGDDVKTPLELCQKKFGVRPSTVLMYRSIVGDASDKIPGVVPRFPHDYATFIAAAFSNPDAVENLQQVLDVLPQKISEAKKARVQELLDKKQLWRRNFEVMRLRTLNVIVAETQPITAEELITNFGMASIKRLLAGDQVALDDKVTA